MLSNILSSTGNNMADILSGLTDEVVANLSDSQKINIQILQNLTSINTRVNDLTTDVSTHSKILITGNGIPSLQERMRKMEEFAESVKYWERFVGGAIIIQTLALAFGIVIALVRVLPLLQALASKP